MHDLVRSALVLALASAPLAIAGCDGDSPTEVHSYVDSAGRSCTVDANDISGTATCDVSPTLSCASGTDPVFVINDDYDTMTSVWTLESCAGCINRPMHTTNIDAPSCATITCMTNADCIHSNYTCMSGICRHM